MNQKTTRNWNAFIDALTVRVAEFPLPMCDTIIAEYGKNPFLILISCLLSLRARDVVTIHACRTLFSRIRTPQELATMPREELEKIIYKTGFYQNKARTLQAVSIALIKHHDAQVPATEAELLALPGVGQKTANLVLGLAFDTPAICVDTHVHRISNLWGIVHTKTPDETEKELKKSIPRDHWIIWNRLLVMLGQNMKDKEIYDLNGHEWNTLRKW